MFHLKTFDSEFLYTGRWFTDAKQSATDVLRTASNRAIQKTAEATGDLIVNKIADKITKVLRGSLQNNSETVESETENTGLDRIF